MQWILKICAALAVMGLAFWAYHENYQTQEALKQVRRLHASIGAAHERLGVLRAEWAYLNRPDRLRDLADINFDRLGLLPIQPDAFGSVDQIIYPPVSLPPVTNPVTVSSDSSSEEPL